MRVIQAALVVIVLALSLVVVPAPVRASTTIYAGVDPGGCTLHDAIIAANTDTATGECPAGTGDDFIVLEDEETYLLSGNVLDEPDTNWYGPTGLPVIASNLAIYGNGATIKRDPNGGAFRLLFHESGTLDIYDLTFEDGAAVGSGLYIDSWGGCIYSESTDMMYIYSSTFTGCSAAHEGTAIVADRMKIYNSTFYDNRDTGESTTAVIRIGVSAESDPVLEMKSSTITGNDGYGILIVGRGAAHPGMGALNDVTVLDNGLESLALLNTADAYVGNSILLPQPVSFESSSSAYDLGGNMVSGEPMLGPLQDNGGPTLTRHPLPGSPVINTGSGCQEADQRGVNRQYGGAGCDTGAVEVVAAPTLALPTSPVVFEATGADGADVTFEASAADYAGTSIDVTCDRESGTRFAITTTTVTCTATDGLQQTSSGTFDVVVQDTIAPVTTVAVTAASVPLSDGDVTNSSVTITLSNVEDGSGIQEATYSVTRNNMAITSGSYASSAIFGLTLEGQYVLTAGATDNAGNVEPVQTFSFTIDRTAPSITAPGDITVNATSPSGALVTFGAPVVSDNLTATTTACSHTSGALFPVGTTTVTCTATDEAGNSAQDTFSITVDGTGIQFADLTTMIQQLPISGDTASATTIRRNMLAMVSLAQGFEAAGAEGASCLMLTRLEMEVRTQVSKRRITTRTAQVLYAKIDEVRAAVGCGGSTPE